jgi:signal transduction histidine kinase
LLESEADGPLDDESHEAVSVIRTSGEHLRCLVDDILDLSAMETGQLRLARSVVDVYDLSEQVLREAAAVVGKRNIRLETRGDRGALAWADPRRLRQVLTNLVANALDATAEGHIRISISRSEGTRETIIEVRDSGRGIPEENLDAIFEAYRQGSQPKARGVGLGLAIARRLVLLHEGSIDVVSDTGRGTTFTLRMPNETRAESLPRDSLVPWSDGTSNAAEAAASTTIEERT